MNEFHMVTVRNITAGHRGLCPTCPDEEGNITLEPGEKVDVQLTELEIEDAKKTGWFEFTAPKGTTDHDNDGNMGGGPVPTPGDDEGEEAIRAAILALDPDNNEHWTANGSPSVEGVSSMLGKHVSRAAITAAAPDAARPQAD